MQKVVGSNPISRFMHVGPVIGISDLEAARDFYEGKLGLEGEEAPGGWAVHGEDGTVAYLLNIGDDAGSAGWPVASFRVNEARAKARELRERGVEFLGPEDVPFDLDEYGVSEDTSGMQVAWMRDPDGSVLTIFSLDD